MTRHESTAARISVDLGNGAHALVVSPPAWKRIRDGHTISITGTAADDERYATRWMFSGGLGGTLRIIRRDGEVGFDGSLRQAGIVEFADPVWEAYATTVFEVDRRGADGRPLEIRVGRIHPALDAFVRAHGAASWTYLTAWNPGDERPTPDENRTQNESLCRAIEELGLTTISGRGRGADPHWEAEESFLVIGATPEQGVALGRRHRQRAIVAGRHGDRARLLDCAVDASEQMEW